MNEQPQRTRQDPEDIKAAILSLRKLHAEVEESLASVRQTARTSGILALISVVLLAAALFFAYDAVAGVNARGVVLNLRTEVDQFLTQARMKKLLTDSAPEVIQSMEDMIRSAPDEFTKAMNDQVTELVDQEIEKLEIKIRPPVNKKLEQLAADLKSGKGAKNKTIAKEIAAVYSDAVVEAVDERYGQYQPKLRELTAYLNKIADGESLSEKEMIERRLILTLFAISQKKLGF